MDGPLALMSYSPHGKHGSKLWECTDIIISTANSSNIWAIKYESYLHLFLSTTTVQKCRIMVCTMQHSVKNKITVHKSSKVNKSNVSLPALLLYYEIMRLCSSVINGNYRCELYISALFHNTIDSTFHTIFSDDLIYDFLSKQLHFGRSAVIRVYWDWSHSIERDSCIGVFDFCIDLQCCDVRT